ncbi:hypothetical protein SAMN02927903_02576 [Flavobacterium caeni]|uniref:Uncharacterized protein n=1 Tax=Flavobacterium caeni TaxID=490189 RepID=A0A1G5J753_9FLAO|nr:hypothetical protein SAMN02927903_02576 [Flavobacterium caeni]
MLFCAIILTYSVFVVKIAQLLGKQGVVGARLMSVLCPINQY